MKTRHFAVAAATMMIACSCANLALAAGTQWAGTINCSYGSGSLKLTIDANGRIEGSVTNGRINHGGKQGTNIYFETHNAFGNRAVFRGQLDGFSMSGTYTQTANKETCRWQASMVGAFQDKPKSLKEEAGDGAFKVLKKGVRKVVPEKKGSDKYRLKTPDGWGPGVRG